MTHRVILSLPSYSYHSFSSYPYHDIPRAAISQQRHSLGMGQLTYQFTCGLNIGSTMDVSAPGQRGKIAM